MYEFQVSGMVLHRREEKKQLICRIETTIRIGSKRCSRELDGNDLPIKVFNHQKKLKNPKGFVLFSLQEQDRGTGQQNRKNRVESLAHQLNDRLKAMKHRVIVREKEKHRICSLRRKVWRREVLWCLLEEEVDILYSRD